MKKFLNGPWVLLLPTVIVLVCVVFLPLLISLWTSFTPFKLTRPDTLYKFVGFRNYERLLGNYDFWIAFGRTVLFLTIALNLELVFGLGIALLINKITYAQKTLRTLMMFPMMFSPILVGFQWKYIFNDNIGLLNNFLREFGVVNPIPWLVDATLANISIMAAEIWSSTSVFAILLLAGLMGIPKDPIEAAKVDGATDFQIFRRIIAPLSRPILVVIFVITFIGIYSDFILAAIFLKDKNLWTVAVGINTVFIDDFNADWGVIAASSVIAATPIAVLFIFFQKQITGGLTAGSVKG